VVLYARKKAKQRGISGWKWGLPVGLVMYLLVFWDHLPTVLAYKYYCKTEAGFTVNKTLEQWKAENPGVAKTLTYEKFSKSESTSNPLIFHLNERFDSVRTQDPIFLSIVRFHSQIIDTRNNEVLAEYKNFRSGGSFQNATDLTDLKLWLANDTCDTRMQSRTKFSKYLSAAKRIGDTER